MPAPTERTVPTSWMSISFSKPFIWVFIRALISSAFIILAHPFQDFFLHQVQLRSYASVNDRVIHPYDEPAQKPRVLLKVQYDLLAGRPGELFLDAIEYGLVRLARALHG